MEVLRWLLRVALASTVGLVVGAATSLPFASQSLGGAEIATPRCTVAGLPVIQNLSGSLIASVTVSSLPEDCGNGTLQLTLSNGIVDTSGSATVPAGGGSVTVTLSPTPAVTASERTDIVVVGP